MTPDPGLLARSTIVSFSHSEPRGVIDIQQLDVIGNDGIPDLFTFTGTSAPLHEARTTSVYCIPIYPEGSDYFDEFSDFVGDEFFPKLSKRLKFIAGRGGLKMGVVSHSANLKPQPIPRPIEGKTLGFDNGILVTLLFGATPDDLPVWLESTRDIIEGHRTDDFWEISAYDAKDWLREMADYIGWADWPTKKYMDL